MRAVGQSPKSAERDIQRLRQVLLRVKQNKCRPRERKTDIIKLLDELIEEASKPAEENVAMRHVKQGDTAEKNDLKHLQRALDRARKNTTRPRERNAKIISLLAQLVKYYMDEDLGFADDEANKHTVRRTG